MDEQEPKSTTAEVKKDLREPGITVNASHDSPACRCKEAQGKTITDFIKVMMDDLAFWRRKK